MRVTISYFQSNVYQCRDIIEHDESVHRKRYRNVTPYLCVRPVASAQDLDIIGQNNVDNGYLKYIFGDGMGLFPDT